MLSPKPWQPDRVVWLIAAFFSCMLLGMIVVQGYQSAFGKEDAKAPMNMMIMLLGTITYQGVTVVLIGVFLRIHHIGWREAFGFKTARLPRTVALAIFTWILILPIALGLNALSQKVLEHFGQHPQAQQTVQALQKSEDFSQQVYFAIMAVLFAPFVEEIIFRGILYPTIKQLGYRKSALWLTSLGFAASHADMPTFLPLTFMALVLTLLYETTDNLLAPILAHSLFNAANFFWILNSGSAPTSP
jgi:hypothetical protein